MAILLQRLYSNAIDLEYSGEFTGYSYTMAAERFEHLGDYRDASEHAANCRRLAAVEKADDAKSDIQRNLYLVACEMALDGYDSEAAVKFKVLSNDDYRNSRRHLNECRQRLTEARQSRTLPPSWNSRPGTFRAAGNRCVCPYLHEDSPSRSDEDLRRTPTSVIRDTRPGSFWERLSRKLFYRSFDTNRSSLRMEEESNPLHSDESRKRPFFRVGRKRLRPILAPVSRRAHYYSTSVKEELAWKKHCRELVFAFLSGVAFTAAAAGLYLFVLH